MRIENNRQIPPASPQKEPLRSVYWTYLGTALLTASVAAALLCASSSAAIPCALIATWFFLASSLTLLSHSVQNSETAASKGIRWLHAVMEEMHASCKAAALFPATLFSNYHVPLGDPKGRPILLLNGYLSFGSTWHSMRKRLATAGCGPIYTMNIGSFHSISEYASQVQRQVKKIEKETGRSDLAVVGHSKGGLVGAYYATQIAPKDGIAVTDLITIGSPLAGTPVAQLGIGEDAREMRPNHPFHSDLRDELGKHPEIRVYNIAAETDAVVPLASALYGTDRSRHKIFKDLGRLSLVFSSRAADQVASWLKA